MTESPQAQRPGLGGLLRKLWSSWATRSLAVGAAATVLDIVVGLICLHLIQLPTRLSAMSGVAIGGAFTFFANRHFAFKEHNPKLAKPALKFILATGLGMLIHGQFVVLMRDGVGIPFVMAKVIADLGVFSVGQLLVLRYLVFPRSKAAEELLAPAPAPEQSEAQRAAGAP
ncbi:MAG: GtrA family protein [Myxococcaceae bacterium]